MSGPIIHRGIEQGSAAWKSLRSGLPTASMFKAILAEGDGKSRASYMRFLAGEILSGEPGDTFKSEDMNKGSSAEPEGRRAYEFLFDVEVEQVSFITNGQKGYSPDGLIGKDGMLELKWQRPDNLIATILKDEFPPEFKAQTQGGLLVSEREWLDLCVFHPRMPQLIKRTYRDENYLRNLSDKIDRFNDDLSALVERIKAYDGGASIAVQTKGTQNVTAASKPNARRRPQSPLDNGGPF